MTIFDLHAPHKAGSPALFYLPLVPYRCHSPFWSFINSMSANHCHANVSRHASSHLPILCLVRGPELSMRV